MKLRVAVIEIKEIEIDNLTMQSYLDDYNYENDTNYTLSDMTEEEFIEADDLDSWVQDIFFEVDDSCIEDIDTYVELESIEG